MAGDDLTKKEARLLVFIAGFVREHDRYPRQDEMAEAMGCSDGTIRNRMKALERSGYIVRRSNKWMGLELTRKGHETAFRLTFERQVERTPPTVEGATPIDPSAIRLLPVVGKTNAGPLTEERQEIVDWYPWIPSGNASSDCYMLFVRGDSMKDAHILPGSRVVVDPDAEPRDGDIVVFLLEGENALKRLHVLEDGTMLLISENAEKNYPPIRVTESDRFKIQGVVLDIVMTPSSRRSDQGTHRL